MRSFRLAIIVGVISTLSFVCSYYYYCSSLTQMEYNQKKYRTIMNSRSEKNSYSSRLDAFSKRWTSLGELSEEKAANINYEITLYPADSEELNEKVYSTYEHGFFFLKRALIEGTGEGIKLEVAGFKRGGAQQ